MYWLGRPKSYHHPSVEIGALKPLHPWCCRFGFKLCNQMVDADADGAADVFFPLALGFSLHTETVSDNNASSLCTHFGAIQWVLCTLIVFCICSCRRCVYVRCVCSVCVCVLATLTMKLEFRSEVLVFVMLINLCQCVVCVSLPESFGSMLLNFFRPCSLFPSLSPSLPLSLSPSHGVVFKNSFFFQLELRFTQT